MASRTIETLVGCFVAAGIGAVAFMALKVGGWDSLGKSESYVITAEFSNIGGLTAKAPVTLAGVAIGRVEDITINRDDYSALVAMRIDSRYDNLPEDTSASILTAGLLGAQYVGLEPGADDFYLEDGGRIQITQSAVVLEHLIGQMLFNQAGGG